MRGPGFARALFHASQRLLHSSILVVTVLTDMLLSVWYLSVLSRQCYYISGFFVTSCILVRGLIVDFYSEVGMKRYHMSRGKSRKVFRKGAKRVHSKNVNTAPMRGGIRL